MSSPAQRLPFGFMNETRIENGYVVKRYVGASAQSRMQCELQALGSNAGRLPVPAVIEARSEPPELVLQRLPGINMAQRLTEEPQLADSLLATLGRLARDLQQHSPHHRRHAPVQVHGDFGPQNVLIDDEDNVTGLLDWEWSSLGSATTDPAWLEWTILMHYPEQTHAITSFYAGYGLLPDWRTRQECMLAWCQRRLDASRANGHQHSITNWEAKMSATEALICPL